MQGFQSTTGFPGYIVTGTGFFMSSYPRTRTMSSRAFFSSSQLKELT